MSFPTHSFRSGRHASTTSDRLGSGLVPHQLLFPTASVRPDYRCPQRSSMIHTHTTRYDRLKGSRIRPTFQMPFVIIFSLFFQDQGLDIVLVGEKGLRLSLIFFPLTIFLFPDDTYLYFSFSSYCV